MTTLPGTDPSTFEKAEIGLAPGAAPPAAAILTGPVNAPLAPENIPVFGHMRQFYNTRWASWPAMLDAFLGLYFLLFRKKAGGFHLWAELCFTRTAGDRSRGRTAFPGVWSAGQPTGLPAGRSVGC